MSNIGTLDCDRDAIFAPEVGRCVASEGEYEISPDGNNISDDVGVVVIGRNEGERLLACLRSINLPRHHSVYVDSGSCDRSVQVARELGWSIVELDLSTPLSAARARNAGLTALIAAAPALKFVQFVDGDCEVAAGWIETAAAHLRDHQTVAVVCGRRRERFPERSIYNQLCDMEWNTPVGQATSCGGDAMMRVDVLARVGGFNPKLIATEEPELCFRLAASGYKIWRLDADMTLHDAAMQHFSQWWRRCMRCGYGNANVAWLHVGSTGHLLQREIARSIVWAGLAPLFAILMTPVFPAALSFFLLYPLQILRIAIKRGPAELQSWQYAFFVMLGKFPECLGTLRFMMKHWRNQQSTLIEYKQSGA